MLLVIRRQEGLSLSYLNSWLKFKTGTSDKRKFLTLDAAAQKLNCTKEDLLILIRNSTIYHGYQTLTETYVHPRVIIDESKNKVKPYLDSALAESF